MEYDVVEKPIVYRKRLGEKKLKNKTWAIMLKKQCWKRFIKARGI